MLHQESSRCTSWIFLAGSSNFKIISMSYIKENLVSSLRGNCPPQKYSALLLLFSEQPAEMWGVAVLFLTCSLWVEGETELCRGKDTCAEVKIPAQEDGFLRKNIQGHVSIMTTSQVPVSLVFLYCRRPVNLQVDANPLTAERLQGQQPQPRDHIRASDAFCS